MLLQNTGLLLRTVIQHVDTLVAGFRPHSLHTRQSFEHALDALLAALSSNSLISDNFQCDRLQHECALFLCPRRRWRAGRSRRRMANSLNRVEEVVAATPQRVDED